MFYLILKTKSLLVTTSLSCLMPSGPILLVMFDVVQGVA